MQKSHLKLEAAKKCKYSKVINCAGWQPQLSAPGSCKSVASSWLCGAGFVSATFRLWAWRKHPSWGSVLALSSVELQPQGPDQSLNSTIEAKKSNTLAWLLV